MFCVVSYHIIYVQYTVLYVYYCIKQICTESNDNILKNQKKYIHTYQISQ